jgi:hypothetical protein
MAQTTDNRRLGPLSLVPCVVGGGIEVIALPSRVWSEGGAVWWVAERNSSDSHFKRSERGRCGGPGGSSGVGREWAGGWFVGK